MKAFFAATAAVLALLSVVAWRIEPGNQHTGKTPIIWASDDNPVRRGQIALFNELNPTYHLSLDPSNAGLQKVIVQSLAGVGPDVFDCYTGGELAAYVRSGIAWDITDELKKMGIDVSKITWPVVQSTCIYEGRVYGFPGNVNGPAFWFNKDIFRRYGVPFPTGPWSWRQMIPIAQKLTIRGRNGRVQQYGLLCDWSIWQQFVRQWGGRVYTPDGTRCIVDSPQAIAGVQFLHDLIYKYHVMPTPVEQATMATEGGWGSGDISVFGAGKAAMAYGGRWWLCSLRSYPGLHLGAVECPHGPVRIYIGGGRSSLINKNSPRRYQALAFIKYLAGKPYNDLINHQADALAPLKSASYTPQYLHDPAYPDEDFNAVWRDVVKYTVPEEVSPFVNPDLARRILTSQMDLVKSDQKSAADALRTAERQINQEIQKSLAIDPVLRARYDSLTRNQESRP